jgi:membrane associated rhomboid family serine protease
MGHKRFLAFYMACGVLAGLAHVVSDPHSVVPCVGASGAIAGVMGAYVSIYPLNRIKVWIVVPFDAPALVVIGVWIIVQFVSAVNTNGSQMAGVAHWAHVGGFFAGFIILRVIVYNLRRQVATSAATRQESDAPVEQFTAAHDPYAGFITMQTIRRMQEKKTRQDPADLRQ